MASLAQPLFGQAAKTQRPEDLTRLLLAQQLLKAGTDTSPIESPWQGVARLGQALAGGYGLHKLGEEQKTRTAETGNALANALRAGNATWTNPAGGTETPAPQEGTALGPMMPQGAQPIAPGQTVPIPGAQGGQAGVIASLLRSNSPGAQQYGTQLQFSQIAEQQKAAAARNLELLKNGMEDDGRGGVRKITNYGPAKGEIEAEKMLATLDAEVAKIRATARPEAEKQALIEELTNKYKIQRAAAGAPRVTIENKGPMEGTGVLFKNAAEAFSAAQTAAMAADKREPLYKALEDASKGFKFGAGAELRAAGLRGLTELGLSDGKAAGWADLAAMAGRQLELANTPKGQGQITENERGLIREGSARMSQTEDGFRLGLELTRKADAYDRKVAQIYRDNARKNGGSYVNPVEVAEEISKLGPVFSAAEENKLRGFAGGGQPSAAAGGKADPLGIR